MKLPGFGFSAFDQKALQRTKNIQFSTEMFLKIQKLKLESALSRKSGNDNI